MSEFALEIRNLVRYYGKLLAVDHLSLQVRRGEVFGFLGPNGAGKTTSIHMMCGLLKPNSGEVFINGKKIHSPAGRKIRSKVGVCPQAIIIWNKLTCFEQLVFMARMYDVPGKTARKRADHLLDSMGLLEKRNKLASTLSGGMKRRMNVILAIVHDPEIVVFDEPEAGLDPQSRIMVREFIKETAREKTVIFTTHNMDEAERVAERVAIIDSGKQPGRCFYTLNGKEAEAMRWYYVFVKSLREQLRDYWILILVVVLAPFMLFMYYLMMETEKPGYEIVFVNQDKGAFLFNQPLNLGDSLIHYMQLAARKEDLSFLHYREENTRKESVDLLQAGKADVLVVIPGDLTTSLIAGLGNDSTHALLEMVGDVTDMDYLVGGVWTQELINRFVQEATGMHLPVGWKETMLGFSGQRSAFEMYVPGLLILSIIMMLFSASAAIVREPETKTLERLKISKLSSLEFLTGLSILQIILAIISLILALLTAVAFGYTLIPGTLWFIFLTGLLTALSMISFSLIVAATCRSIKDVAIIGTFPLFLLMFFSGAAYPISGGKLFSIGSLTLHLNDILSPTWAVDALNKVLIKGQDVRETIPEMLALVILTLLYFVIGVRAFRRRHMRAS